ncbi:MAG: arylamine N-acetyltransferase [Pseudooceanicola sp.]|nr:arylamine N-acetyltransferase [Pseudooceanicola sp.]
MVDDWLARIGAVRAAPSVAALARLQEAQMRAVPFETFEPFLGGTPDLAATFDKVVRGRRGGYCFELNGLFGDGLRALGYDLRRSLGRVRNGAAQGGARTHLCVQVTLDGVRWLADVGFGGHGPLAPLEIGRAGPQQAPNGTYRLVDDPVSGERVVERLNGADWVSLYGFDDAFVGETELQAANWLSANWPMTVFPNHLMLAGHDGATRIGVFDRTVTLTTAEGQTRAPLADFAAFEALVCERLRLGVDRGTLERAWERIEGT